MKRVFRMLMHSHPPGPVFHFWNIARVDLIVWQCRHTFQTLAFRFCDFAVFHLINGRGYHSAGLVKQFLHRSFLRFWGPPSQAVVLVVDSEAALLGGRGWFGRRCS